MSKLSYADEHLIKTMRDAVSKVEASLIEAQKKLDDASGKVQPFEEYPLAKVVSLSMSDGDPEMWRRRLKQAWDESQPVRERNSDITENNAAIFRKFEAMVNNAGIPRTVRRVKKGSRSRYETVDADWWQAFLLAIPRVCGWTVLEYQYKQKMEMLDRRDVQVKAEREKVERERAEHEKTIKRAALCMVLAKKYQCDENPYSVMRAVLGRSKYLHLAHYMRKNQSDWSDGYDYARTGLEGFNPETEQEREIYAEIHELAYDCEDCDGRCFRDCEWNYDRLFGMVGNDDLMADYEQLRAFEGD